MVQLHREPAPRPLDDGTAAGGADDGGDLSAALPQPRSWMTRAACLHADKELFFPEDGVRPEEAKRICAECPVRQRCLDYALADSTLVGVWGGTTDRERREMRKDRLAAAHRQSGAA
jgi:hypothetical protein